MITPEPRLDCFSSCSPWRSPKNLRSSGSSISGLFDGFAPLLVKIVTTDGIARCDAARYEPRLGLGGTAASCLGTFELLSGTCWPPPPIPARGRQPGFVVP